MRPAGIEPALQPWKGCILPLNYRRSVDSVGIEPTASRLQSERSTTELRAQKFWSIWASIP